MCHHCAAHNLVASTSYHFGICAFVASVFLAGARVSHLFSIVRHIGACIMGLTVHTGLQIESVTKVSLSQPTGATKVDKVMEANPMFQMMTGMLEDEPGAVDDIQEMLEKSNGNMFAIMSNPKFQSLAQKMMKNPELMRMMQDPSQVSEFRV